jgi:glutamyl-tRNA synthetase
MSALTLAEALAAGPAPAGPGEAVRVRFAPSPTGDMHVGVIRTALFNYAFARSPYARERGGAFVFRIEDTDRARDSEASYQNVLDTLRWLHLDWDEGPEKGGPYGPYRQSERLGLYREVADRLLEAGLAYWSYSTPEEVRARNLAAGRPAEMGYDNGDRDLDAATLAAFEAEGRPRVLRLRMPDEAIEFDDLVRGTVRFEPEHVSDFVLLRGDGHPLYTLVNPVDDALMRISHVLRGEDLLPSTPRQIALYRALGQVGVGTGVPPQFGHLPFVMGEGNRKLSKRAGEGAVSYYREQGFLPEGMVNYLALLGWSIAEDRDVFTLDEMCEAFDVRRVSPNPARFDLRKCRAINASHVRMLAPDDLGQRLLAVLGEAGYVDVPATPEQNDVVRAAVPLVQERMQTLGEAAGMLGFLFAGRTPQAPAFELDPKAATQLNVPALAAAVDALDALTDWTPAAIEAALRTALVEGLGLKPKHAFGPVRVALTGRSVSPPLFESIELLGRDVTLARLRDALAVSGG